VVRLAGDGLRTLRPARQLVLAGSTVESRLEHVCAEVATHSRYELIAKAADAQDPKHRGIPPMLRRRAAAILGGPGGGRHIKREAG